MFIISDIFLPFKDLPSSLGICILWSVITEYKRPMNVRHALFPRRLWKERRAQAEGGCSVCESRTAEILPFYLESTRKTREMKSHLFSSSSTLTLDIFLEILSLNLALKGSECLLFLPMISFMWFNKEKQETQKSLAGEYCPHVKGINTPNVFSSDQLDLHFFAEQYLGLRNSLLIGGFGGNLPFRSRL